MKIGNMILLYKTEYKHNHQYYKVKCEICGEEREVSLSNLKRKGSVHSWSSCRTGYIKMLDIDLGDYEVIGVSEGNKALIRCRICNHEYSVYEASLTKKTHSASRCKEDFYKNLVGTVVNNLKITEIFFEKNVSIAKCICLECGMTRTNHLSSFLDGKLSHKDCVRFIPDTPIKKKLMSVYNGIVSRTGKACSTKFKNYGGRGIKNEFKDFVEFYNIYKEEFEKNPTLTFDRIDVNGNYSKKNIRLISFHEQQSNKNETRRFLAFKDGKTVLSNNSMEFGRKYNVNGRSVGNCLRGASKTARGWKFKNITKEYFDNLLMSLTTKPTSVIVVEELQGEIPCGVAPSTLTPNSEGKEIV